MTDPAVRRVVSDIKRSPEDKRAYRGLEFTNGLKAMLISDPTTDKSSAALDVHIGLFPEEKQLIKVVCVRELVRVNPSLTLTGC